MKYLIGLDCGATKTECAVADVDGNILYTAAGKPVNLLVAGTYEASKNILSLIKECESEFNFTRDGIEQLVVGAAGAGRKNDADNFKSSLSELLESNGIKIKSLHVVTDARIALNGAFPKSSGCILIAGTGSIIYGKDDRGNIYRAGGFGRLIGDEGSGYSIGRKALQAAAKYFDNRNEKTQIADLLADEFNIKTTDDLINKVYKENIDIAAVAKLTLTAAESGDNSAIKILDDESNELMLHIKTILDKINSPDLKLTFAGSLLTNDNIYSKMLKEKIQSSFPAVKIVEPKHQPVEGAILIAKEMLND
ncbi:glucosamine kinase GspK [bacterium BMS3Abin03]|nr:glucosamine kinase GspK [bacterium BMS3Abin03]